MKAAIVEDEAPARRRLRRLLAAHPDVTLVGEAATVSDARELVLRGAPDVLFLDVQIGGGTGFDVLDRLGPETPSFALVFVTAFDAHAVRAFEVKAIDYLVKPVHPERLAQTLERLRSVRSPPRVVPLPNGAETHLAHIDEILRIESRGDYSEVFLDDGTPCWTDRAMASWEERLGRGFVRIHRGTIVRVGGIRSLTRDAGAWWVVLRDGVRARVGRTRLDSVRAALASE